MTELKQTKNYITPKQKAILDFISDHLGRFGYAPTQSEIAKATGCGRSLVLYHINRLQDLGFIRLTSQFSRNIEVTHSY